MKLKTQIRIAFLLMAYFPIRLLIDLIIL